MFRANVRARLRTLRAALVTTTLVVGGTGLGVLAITAPSSADTAPTGGLPATVSADALPTWQVNGVVWSQVVVGNTVYVTGSFTQARPPGVAVGGAGTVAANDIFAYNITTGNAVTSFSHQLNAQGLAITASPDGSRVYVGGDFTTVDGTARNHIAAFDTATGALDTAFHPSLSSQVRALTVSPSTVYAGGNFTTSAGLTRKHLAAFAPANGALLSWAPSADDNKVSAMVMSPDGSKVIVGGAFTTLNGVPASGMGALDASTGATAPWAINQVVTDGGTDCGITNLSVSGSQVYGGGYAFGCGNFEGTFAADGNTGALSWVNDCHGDTYSTYPTGQVLYSVSHAHNCSFIGDFPNSPNWATNMRHALAFTTYPTGTNTGPDDYGWNFNNVPDSTLLQWFPVLALGTYTGQNQAAWSVTGNGNYVVLGGEFPSVNGTAQQGLVRFATSGIAPNKRGPAKAPGAPATSAQSFTPGTARVAWQSAYDMDNKTLTYNVYRSGTAAPVYTTTQDSTYWVYPMMGFVDHGLSPGTSYTYTVKVTDPFGNLLNLGASNSVTTTTGTPSQYSQDVLNDGASDYWRLGEASGTAVYDHAGFNDATAQPGVTRGATGAISGDSDQASSFDGATDGFVTTNSTQAPTPSFSIESWIKTTTNQGGKIVGYGDANAGTSGSYDRHIYMDNAGHIIFGVYNNGTYTITSPGTYNDGNYHQIVGTMDATKGMVLYIDGKKVGVNQSGTVAQPYTGYWRIGGDNLNGWPNQPSSSFLNGSIDDVSIYPSALALAKVQQHYVDAGGSLNIPQAPTDNYGKTIFNAGPDLYWRLGDASGTTATDTSPNGDPGVISGGVTLNQPGGVAGTTDTAASFNGANGTTIGSANQQAGPSVYSEELWFKTGTTQGGKLIGFGDQQSGASGNYDRHVYMENSGQLTFGVWTGTTNTATSPLSYNDNHWHYMVATQGPDGMHLYVDGVEVATNQQTQQQPYNGYWRVGGDSDWGGNSPWFNGTIDEVAVYSSELSASDVHAHYVAGGGTVANQPPVASYTDSEAGLKASFDGSASHDTDGGTITSYAWDFGDGGSDTSVSPNHTYLHAGDYTVALTVTDNQGGTNTSSHSVQVTNTKPTAAFSTSTIARTVSVDGSASSDPDGSITSYDWDWGDGSLDSSGVSPSHTYGANGTYTITLTVTDSDSGTGNASHDVQPSMNQPPVASFTDSEAGLKASFDGSASHDTDGGTITSYAWDFGDGAQSSAVSPNHTYGATGDYTVALTVTDNQGGTDTSSHLIHVTNTAPNAVFTSTVNGLTVSVDGSGSNDPDGSIASYDWDWGDGSLHSSGVSPSHTYGAAGPQTITLTVTDNAGGNGSVQHSVTTTNPAPTLLASDDFGRTATNGWGNADLGGAWTVTGNKANFKVGSGVGTLTLPTAGSGPWVNLNSVSTTNSDVRVVFSPQQIANGLGAYISLIGRQVPNVGNYREVVNVKANGQVALTLVRIDGAGQATITGPTTIAGLTVAAGDKLDARLVVTGTSPTVLEAKVWKDGTAEPATWQITGADTSAAMQAAGSVGVVGYLAANATNAPVATTFDTFRAYDATTTQNNAQGKLLRLAQKATLHPSLEPTAATRVAPDFRRVGVGYARKR